jgi:hypothetical protein
MFVFFSTFYMENSHDVHATCFTINGTEECSTLPPLLTSIKSHYVPNEMIQLAGTFRPNAMIQIDLVDPNDNIKNSVLIQSDSSGSFQSKMVVPNDAVNGTWKINTSSGLNHSTHYITVISKNLQDNQTNPNHSMPVTLTQSPLKQFKSGVLVKDITCSQGLQLILKAEDSSPACVASYNINKLIERGWAKQELYYVDPHMNPKIALYDYYYDGIDKDNTTVSINNQTYYQTTLNYADYDLKKGTLLQVVRS